MERQEVKQSKRRAAVQSEAGLGLVPPEGERPLSNLLTQPVPLPEAESESVPPGSNESLPKITRPPPDRLQLTHDLGSSGGPNNDGEVGGNEGHARLHILIDAVLRLVELQGHITGLLNALQLLLRQLLPTGKKDEKC